MSHRPKYTQAPLFEWGDTPADRPYAPNAYDSVKEAPEKSLVRAAFVAAAPAGGRVMTLPGRTWKTELLLQSKGVVKFTACERHAATFLAMPGYMPRSLPGLNHWRNQATRAEFFATDSAKVFHMDANDMILASGDRWREFRRKHGRWDAVWLDYCGPLSMPVLRAASRLRQWVRRGGDAAYVGITFMGARDSREMSRLAASFGGRFELLEAALADGGGFSKAERFTYGTSANNVSMHHLSGYIEPPASGSAAKKSPTTTTYHA